MANYIKKILYVFVGAIILMSVSPTLAKMAADFVTADAGDNPILETVFTLLAWLFTLVGGVYLIIKFLGDKD